jgi:hypothetical protein
MRIFDGRYSRDLRRHNLALRLIVHQARTATIERWTGLTPFRIRAMFHAYAESADRELHPRHRGAAPRRPTFFFKSPRHEFEAANFAICCHMTEALPRTATPHPERTLPSLEYGERLCEAFESFCLVVPGSILTVEHAILFVFALARGDQVALGRCEICAGLVVVNRLELRKSVCVWCARDSADCVPFER